MAGYKGMAKYSRELKVKACKMYFENGKKVVDICKELGIKNRAQPQSWLNEYRNGGGYDAVGIKEKGKKKLSRIDETAYRIRQLTIENELLRDFLQMLERVC
jgi:transposase-like protein